MSWTRCILAGVAVLTLISQSSAQFVFGLPTVGQSGIGFRMGGRHLRVEGFLPTGDPYPAILPVTPTPFGLKPVGPAYVPFVFGNPYAYPPLAPGFPFPGYGAISQRVTIQIINPPIAAASRRSLNRDAPDLSGIDLDIESPEKIWGKRPEVAKAPAAPQKKVEIAAAPAKPPPPPPPPRKVEPVPDGQRLIELGIAAFRAGEYGLALLRFRQAAEADPPGPRAAFLQAQASIAMSQYRDAAKAIRKGLETRPDWPVSGFRPRIELYENKVDIWKEHVIALEKALKLDANNGDLFFLLGYLAWFDGERDAAIAHFQDARVFAGQARWSDMFLRIAKK
jgi:hypothetical protein